MAKSFIHCKIKNGIEYASVYTPRREGGKKVNDSLYLGRVLDKERGIYQSRNRGIFAYDLSTGYGEVSESDLKGISPDTAKKEKLILDFGDAYFLFKVLQNSKIYEVLTELIPQQNDTLLSIICYRLFVGKASCCAEDWWGGFLLPHTFSKCQAEIAANQRILRGFR